MKESKYFRVGAFYRDPDSQAVILQCQNRQEAEQWVPKVKQMLYPGEDTQNYSVHIFEFKLQINQNQLNHYRITVNRPTQRVFDTMEEEMEYDNSLSFDAVVEAESEEEAKAVFFSEWFPLYAQGKTPEVYDIYVDEVPLSELVEKEKRMLRQRLVGRYILKTHGDISVREYSRMMRKENEAEQERFFYEGLKNHLHRLRTADYLERRLDTERMSHAEFCRICDELSAAKVGDAFEAINRAAIETYGKEVENR